MNGVEHLDPQLILPGLLVGSLVAFRVVFLALGEMIQMNAGVYHGVALWGG